MLDVSGMMPTFCGMTKFSTKVAAMLVGAAGMTVASAHPGHAPADLTAQLAHPLAGLDHALAFVLLSAFLLLVLRALVKNQRAEKSTTRK